VYIVEPPSPATLALARLVSALGADVRRPLELDQRRVLLVEIVRPDGVICGLAGHAYATALDADRGPRDLAALAARFPGAGDEPEGLWRAPRLRAAILELQRRNGAADAMDVVVRELLQREAPLYVMRAPNGEIRTPTFDASGRAVPVYADLACMHSATEDLQLADIEAVAVPARVLFGMAIERGLGMAVCTYRDRKTPVYAILPNTLIARVAGELGG
jgi:hypothetical protein